MRSRELDVPQEIGCTPRVLDDPVSLLNLLAALGAGLIAGVFFAFSSFVMKALARLPAEQGVAAMQSINVVVLNRWFLSVFLGTALLSLGLAIHAVFDWTTDSAVGQLAGATLYFLGTFVVTITRNVPLNDRLAKLEPHTPAAADFWPRYVLAWTAWNHVRTLAAFLAAAAFISAIAQR